MISVIWLLVIILATTAIVNQDTESALAWFGAILAGSVAAVSVVHLVRARPQGFVRELIYVAGGSYLIMAALSAYLFLRG
jgi:hypothetical protein